MNNNSQQMNYYSVAGVASSNLSLDSWVGGGKLYSFSTAYKHNHWFLDRNWHLFFFIFGKNNITCMHFIKTNDNTIIFKTKTYWVEITT